MSGTKKCSKCQQPIKGGEKYFEEATVGKVDYYHATCLAEKEKEDSQPKCIKCGVSIEGKTSALCDKCVK